MPVEDAPDDDDVRQTYNFAPGYHGLVYRADVPDWGGGNPHQERREGGGGAEGGVHGRSWQLDAPGEMRYKLQSMKWGLIPFWTKRNPDYGTVMRTINARDDSLAAKGGMWSSMKQKKRCIVVAQGFYEWLKKHGGKEKIPHYVKRRDEQLMCFAGLWDCVQYEDSDEKHYTYTIITTNSNKQLSFLHDRMPVILENGSDQIRTWLDPGRSEWSKELQSLLKPFEGELDCYPVSKEVGKVGNNSPAFIVPVVSSENKNSIANFFGNAKKAAQGSEDKGAIMKEEQDEEKKGSTTIPKEADEKRRTVDHDGTEDNAPLPMPSLGSSTAKGTKRQHEADDKEAQAPEAKTVKGEGVTSAKGFPQKTAGRGTRSATNNGTAKASPTKGDGNQKITAYF